jgi:DNA-binding transcriptional regulator YdaS (Cro superfamily)
MEPDEFLHALEGAGGVKPLARSLGIAPNTVRAYRDGASRIPPTVAAALRCSTGVSSADGGSKNPLV